MKTLEGKTALVTGSSKGIGANVAKQLAEAGAELIVNYVNGKEEADAVVAEIKEKGGNAIAVKADVSKTEDVKRLFDEGISKFGKIDILVNNAGIMITKPLKDTTDEILRNNLALT